MAEVKNSFLSSKMNKDLDDRLIPNSEYRDALNIEVGKSETNNIGVLQNVYGNAEVLNNLGLPYEANPDIETIGIFMDNQNNRIYQFLTDYTDETPSQIILPTAGKEMKITVYDLNTATYSTLVEGIFLNFSKTNLIVAVNLIEGLLFWSDNRNQPRKINYKKAINNPNYYTTETQISVAKYAPVEPISLVRKATATVVSGAGDTYVLDSINGIITEGMTVVSSTLSGSEYAYVMSFSVDTIVLYNTPISPINAGDKLIFLISTMSDQTKNPDWPGDPAFLEDKYVRFSYRFKFDDNEYSLMAPFTQIAYIPRQKGYFISGDETSAYRSTIVKWMENYVNNIELLIPLPDKGLTVNDSYKITDLEILYKESDALSVKVIDTIPWNTIKNTIPNTNIYTYPYQSQKPYKTLNENQTTRVYDVVPTRALSQEIAGNRVIYGNFYNMYSPPATINYNTAVQPKSDIFTSFIEYPNHTLKQNRNYQVGFVLADKFGRQSSVILSSVDLKAITPGVGGPVFGGSTVYAPYQSETVPFPDVRDWFGNALLVLVNDPIASQRNIPQGTPGLYAEPTSTSGFAITAGTISNNTYSFTIDTTPPLNVIPVVGQYMRGEFTDYVEITNVTSASSFPDPPSGDYVITTTGQINNLYLPAPPIIGVADIKFAYTINEIGWYSYKVVVKQQQQDYYNTYLPGMLDGYPSGQTFGSQVVYTGVSSTPELENAINTTSFPVGEQGKTSHIVLINDNINKVPRDLSEVGPDQKQYRSSVQLFGRVENTAAQEYLIGITPYDNKYATTITYLLIDNPTALSTIKPGDGIQSDEANTAVPNPDWPGVFPDSPPPTVDNPDAWYANTVVVSNELLAYTAELDIPAAAGGDQIKLTATTYQQVEAGDIFIYTIGGISYNNTVDSILIDTITTLDIIPVTITTDTILYFTNPNKAIITFSPPNQTRATSLVGSYVNFTITRPENTQYFPARKADVVSSIATSTEFNFLDNTVNNVKGSAGLNFYQLQTNPLIGRVTTTKSIGVVSESMIPFLSVYETAPDVSALALFWETASTGLISDLNYDVSTGFDGPSQFGDLVFRFFEDQNPAGASPITGDTESKYITDAFNILNNTGFPITPDTDPIFDSVETVSGLIVTEKFDIEPTGLGTWRFIIKDDFVFDHDAPNNSTFNFFIKVTYNSNDYIILYTNRLGNSSPLFVESFPFYNKTIEQVAGSIEFITAENGSHRIPAIPPSGVDNQTDLWWTINSGDVPGYFSIDNTTGELFLLNEDIPLGIYQLEIKVQDAFSTTPLLNVDADYATKEALIDVNITVGPKPVNNYLQRYDTGEFVWEVSGSECISVAGQGYGAVYIGPNDYSLVDHKNAGLPDLMNTTPYSGDGSYQSYVNVEIANGANFIANPPTGLTQGELQFTIKTSVQGFFEEIRTATTNFILYFKEPVAPNNTWQPILDSNNVGSPNSSPVPFQNGVGDALRVRIIENGSFAERSTALIVSNPAGVPVGEYCLVVWHDYVARRAEGIPECGYDVYSSVQVKDANYDYPGPDTDPSGPAIVPPNTPPLPIVPIPYTVQLEEYFTDYPSAIPYDTQDATRSFIFETSAVLAEATVVGSNIIKITTPNAQIVPGSWLLNEQVTDIQIDGVTIILSSNIIYSTPAGATVTFGTFNHPSFISRTGTVWAATNNPLHVTQFYSDSALSTIWEPPVADKFYLFYNTNRNFDESIVSVPGTPNPTNKPLCCAQFDANGKVIQQTSPNNTIQTAWSPGVGPVANYGRNLSQFTTL